MTGGLLIFIFALLVCTLLLSIIETIALHSFSPLFFRIGFPVYRRTIDLPTGFVINLSNKTIRKMEGKFRFTTDNQVLFLSQLFLFKMSRFNTAFPLKITGTITTVNQMNIVARLPVGSTLFNLFFLTAFFKVFIVESGNSSALTFGLFPLAFVGALFGSSFFTERRRLKTMISELQEIINEQNTNSNLSSENDSLLFNQSGNKIKTQQQGGFPLKTTAAITIVVIWNILFLMDFLNFFGKQEGVFTLGLGAQLGLGFILVTCFLLLTFEPVRRIILKEGRSIVEIKSFVFLLIFVCGSMLLMLTLTS